MFETSVNLFPGFEVEIQGIYREVDTSGRVRLHTYVGLRIRGSPTRPMANEQPGLVIRPSRDDDVEAMLAIYRHHIRRGSRPEGVDDNGTPQPDDLRDRRKNLRNRRLPHLVATLGETSSAMLMWCRFASGRPTATPSSIRSMSITRIRAAASDNSSCRP